MKAARATGHEPPPPGTRTRVRRAIALSALCLSTAFAGAFSLPGARDLAADARDARDNGRPLLVLYSQAGCTWCEEARRYIAPIAVAPETRDQALFRQVDIDSDAELIDFTAQASSHRRFAQAQQVSLTPTVVLYGPDGRVIGEPIVGMRLPDFYAQYLLNAVDAARAEIATQVQETPHTGPSR